MEGSLDVTRVDLGRRTGPGLRDDRSSRVWHTIAGLDELSRLFVSWSRAFRSLLAPDWVIPRQFGKRSVPDVLIVRPSLLRHLARERKKLTSSTMVPL